MKQQNEIVDLVKNGAHRRVKFRSIPLCDGADGIISCQVTHGNSAGSYELSDSAAAFPIIVVVQEDAMTKDFDVWDKQGMTTIAHISHMVKRGVGFVARPGAFVFFLGMKPGARTQWTCWTKAAEHSSGRGLRFYDAASSELHLFWKDLASAAAHVALGIELPAATRVCKNVSVPNAALPAPPPLAHIKRQMQVKAQVPLSWRAVPSIQLLYQTGNRGRRYTGIVLEGTVDANDTTLFTITMIPKKHGEGIFLMRRARNPAAGHGPLADIEDKAHDDMRHGVFVPGDVFALELVESSRSLAPLSGSAVFINVRPGMVLSALPWSEQPRKQQMWENIWSRAMKPRLEGTTTSTAAATAAAAAQTASAAGAVSQEQSLRVETVAAAAADYIFQTPSSVLTPVFMRLKPVLPTQEAFDDYQTHTVGPKDCACHFAAGLSRESHVFCMIESETTESDAEAAAACGAAADNDEEKKKKKKSSNNSISSHFSVLNYNSLADSPIVSIFLGRHKRVAAESLASRTSPHQHRIGHADTGAPIYLVVQLLCNGTKLPMVCELCDFAAVSEIAPPEYFGVSSSSLCDSSGNCNSSNLLSQSSMIDPWQLYQQKSFFPTDAAAVAARDARADLIVSHCPLFQEEHIKHNYDKDAIVVLLLGRNLFSGNAGHASVELEALRQASKDPAAADRLLKERVERNRAATAAEGAAAAVPAVVPSLLEWALGVWLPPFPPKINTSPNRSSSRFTNPAVFGIIAAALATTTMTTTTGLSRLIQIAYKATLQSNYTGQMCNGVHMALAERSMWAWLPPSFIPRDIVLDISTTSATVVNSLLRTALVAAKSGNMGLVAGIATRLLSACCYDSTKKSCFSSATGPHTMSLFPPGNPAGFAPLQPVFFPTRDWDAHTARLAASKSGNGKLKFALSLDHVIVALTKCGAVLSSEHFAPLLAHLAFAQIRMVMQTRKDRAGAQFQIDQAGSVDALGQQCTRIRMNPAADDDAAQRGARNERLLRGVSVVITHAMNWNTKPPHAASRLLSPVPASVAVAVWFLHELLEKTVARRINAQPQATCDASFLTGMVASFLLAMP